jgi:integrase
MASYRKRGRVWYYRFADSDGIRREAKGCTDRRETEAMAAAREAEASKVRSGYIDPREPGYALQERRPLADHLKDFVAALAAKGGSPNHCKVSATRIGRIIAIAGFRRISDLSLSRSLDALATLRADGFSQETINHHIRAVKAFSRWLWRDKRDRDHALAHLATKTTDADRRRTRRALTPEEAIRLVSVTEPRPLDGGLSGPDRAMLYSIALATGLRRDELKSITPESFDLQSTPPVVRVLAGYCKNGKEAIQPLPEALAVRLAPWLAVRPSGEPVFGEMSRRIAEGTGPRPEGRWHRPREC